MMIGTKSDVLSTEEFGCSPSERAKSRRYMIEMILATCIYAGCVSVSAAIVDGVAPGPLKVLVALIPMIGASLMAAAFVRFIVRADEMQRQMIVMSAAIAAAGTAIVTMTLGFLENAGVARVSMIWVWPIIALFIGVSLPFIRRRYR